MPDTPHPHSPNDESTQLPCSVSNCSGHSCCTEVADSYKSLSDGEKVSFSSQTGRNKNTSFESIISSKKIPRKPTLLKTHLFLKNPSVGQYQHSLIHPTLILLMMITHSHLVQ